MLPWSLAFPSFRGYVVLFMWNAPIISYEKVHPSLKIHFNGHFLQKVFPDLLLPSTLANPWHLFSSISPCYPAIEILSLHLLNYLQNNLERELEMPKAVMVNCSSIFSISGTLFYSANSWILPVLCPSLSSFTLHLHTNSVFSSIFLVLLQFDDWFFIMDFEQTCVVFFLKWIILDKILPLLHSLQNPILAGAETILPSPSLFSQETGVWRSSLVVVAN